MVSAADQFAALMASSLPRCGALSPARPVCCAAPLARHLWCEWVAGPRVAAEVTLVVANKHNGAVWGDAPAWQSVAFGVSRATLGVTRGGRVGASGVFVGWAAPGVSLQRSVHRAVSLHLRREKSMTTVSGGGRYGADHHNHVNDDYVGGGGDGGDGGGGGGGMGSGGQDGGVLVSRDEVLCDAVNSKWWVTCERAVVRDEGKRGTASSNSNGVTLAITGIHCYTAATATTGAAVTVPRLFLNNVFPDEALLTLNLSTQEIFLTLFDVNQTAESRRISVLAQTSMGTRGRKIGDSPLSAAPSFQGVPVTALVLRREKTDGSIVFVLKPSAGAVFQVEAATGETKVLSTRCTDLSQLSETMFCIGSTYGCEKSYELWDCHNVEQPVRCFQSGDNFDQVIGGCGFLFAVSERDRKIHVIDASSGLAAMITLDVLFASTFYIIQQSSIFIS
ncbi:hypothetical protein Pelo_1430 [Pelomyxa schiedti]|nr:hypothetical protein Pelo_1430 [Pelomyxa schiedti]